MYLKSYSIALFNSISMAPHNLSVVNYKSLKSNLIAFISKNSVILTSTDNKGQVLNSKQICPKVTSKDSATKTSSLITICEARLVQLPNRILLVVLTTLGIFFYGEDGEHLLHYQSIKNYGPSVSENTTYARGLALIPPSCLAIGTSSGTVVLYDVSNPSSIGLLNEVNEKSIQSGIVALSFNEQMNLLAACDTTGNIVVWSFKSPTNIKLTFSLRPKHMLCTSMSLWESYLVCGFSNGFICFYDLKGNKLVEILAHARWIASLDIFDNRLVTSSEDCFFRVWQINTSAGKLRITHSQNENIVDSFVCAAIFDKTNGDIFTSSYDSNEIIVYSDRK